MYLDIIFNPLIKCLLGRNRVKRKFTKEVHFHLIADSNISKSWAVYTILKISVYLVSPLSHFTDKPMIHFLPEMGMEL